MPGAGEQLAVGSTIWQSQCVRGATCERENWVPMKIIGETSRSWIVGPEWDQEKIPKKGPRKGYWALSPSEVDDAVYLAENRRHIAETVRYCSDPAKLRQIAAIVGWTEVDHAE